MKKSKFILFIFIVSIILTGCATTRPIYEPGTDKEKYNEKLVEYYQKQQK